MKLNILFLCNQPKIGQDANTIIDHINAFESYSKHILWICSNIGDIPPKLDLNKFDVIIIHYSLSLLSNRYISKKSKIKLKKYTGLKVVFVQDEYRKINKMINELLFLNIDILFTCFPENEKERIYKKDLLPNVSTYSNLTGYIPKRLLDIPNHNQIINRPIHVGYRSRLLPFWYGELAYEKWDIVEKWKGFVQRSDIKVDISYNEKDRIYGKDWNSFLLSCKTTLGVESGASVMDFTGDIESTVDLYQLMHPNKTFYQVQKKFLTKYEGKYNLNQISPRCFEAIALKTVLVLYEGKYSGILEPGRHYIELKKDFSNIVEVLGHIKDDDFLQNMADVAYQEIALNAKYSYKTFVDYSDEVISKEFASRNKRKINIPYKKNYYQIDVYNHSLKRKLYKISLENYQKLPPKLGFIVKGIIRPKSSLRYLMRVFFRLINYIKKK